MGRQTLIEASVPGSAPALVADTADARVAAQQDDDSSGETKFVTDKPRRATDQDKDARIAELEAALAAQQKLPQPVYEPVTPHGAAALKSSDMASMTVAQVMAAIDAGKLREPLASYLCADGYYARRG